MLWTAKAGSAPEQHGPVNHRDPGKDCQESGRVSPPREHSPKE